MKKDNSAYSGKHAAPAAAERRPERSRPRRRRRTGLTVALVVLLVLAAVIAAGLFYYNSKLDRLNYDDTEVAENVSAKLDEELRQQAESGNSGGIIPSADAAPAPAAVTNEPVSETPAPAPAPAGQAAVPVAGQAAAAELSGSVPAAAAEEPEDENPDDTLEVGDHEVKTSGGTKTDSGVIAGEDCINILVIGSDQRIPHTSDRGRADAVMLVSLDKSSGSVRMASFERAMGVPVAGQLDSKLNDLLNIGDAILIQKTISECFSVKIDGFVHLDYDSFPKVIDAIGGIDLEFDAFEAGTFNGRITLDARSTFVAQVGKNHLPGYEALVYCRLRTGDDNWGRQARTRAVLGAAVDKVKDMSLLELNALANEVLPLIHTNLTKTQISSILLSAPKFLSPQISQLMLPDKDRIWVYHGEKGEAMYGYDFDYETERLRSFIEVK